MMVFMIAFIIVAIMIVIVFNESSWARAHREINRAIAIYLRGRAQEVADENE